MNAKQPVDIFNVNIKNFESAALEMFHYQCQNNAVYSSYVARQPLKRQNPANTLSIPFLPVSFFKTHQVVAFVGNPDEVFTSSGTTGLVTSRHFVKQRSIYEQSFIQCFRQFYGHPAQYAFLCLLPSYLERSGSSLIYMAEKLIQLSGDADSGFFLKAEGQLEQILKRRESEGKKSFLLGVTFALLDFASASSVELKNTIVMETGGMKGRRLELTRQELHDALKQIFGIGTIHSEYGMTELLSQAYSSGGGIYRCPPWMKVFVRDEDDPFTVRQTGTGLLCLVDLANMYSCSFIEIADIGTVFHDGSFEVLGRIDNSDIRGCSLLTA
jgi:hypothetical protein